MAASTKILDETAHKVGVLFIKDLHLFTDEYKQALEWLKRFRFQS